MPEPWGFINTGHHSAAVNMAMDEALLNWHSKGKIPPTIRFYGWSKPSLSVGHFQKVEKTIDFHAVDRHGCQFVRRLTGGSAVLHDEELTYSIVVSEDHPAIPKSIREAYAILTKGIMEGYRNLGIHAEYAYPDRESIRDRSAVCFEKAAYYEMIIDGKKISGNAQTRKQGVLLQHGSIPMRIHEEMLFDLFLFPSERVKERQRKAFRNKAIAIDAILNKRHTYDMLTEAFFDGFQTGLDLLLEPITLTNEHWEEVYDLAERKYAAEVLS